MSHSVKKIKINILKSISFLIVCILVSSALSMIFIPKRNDLQSGIKFGLARGFYGEPKNSLDIIGIGDSDLACAYSPIDMWNQHGFTGYNCSEPWQTTFEAYGILSDVMTCQKPKVVILEVDGLFPQGSYVNVVCKFFDTKLKQALPIFEYHNRWKNLNKDDLTKHPSYKWTNRVKGYWVTKDIKPMTVKPRHMYSKIRDQIDPLTMIQLNDFRELCEKNGAQLILAYMPTSFSWNQNRHDNIEKYANKYNMPFLDLNTCAGDYDLDWNTDSWDGGIHLNCNGAVKVTKYLGDYLNKHYSIPNHKDDKTYSRWDTDYNTYIGK